MEAAYKFSVNGLNMEFAINLVMNGRSILGGLFVDILTEKCQLIHQHLKASKDCLLMVANINNTIATIKVFDRDFYTVLFSTTVTWKSNCTGNG